ncbi:UPF0481 protein At3g47200-like [Phoenix dactylifera]|uniref:UPF0481 protein At3g47200-like n=1 Tax=Phoenix dactylifera TaxID=42345 RepID=A0A8B7CJ07_PHODC|nr:UPF0481 protein At3g47200-like [Phoenix dactylifera]
MAETEGARTEVLERKRALMEELAKSTTISSSWPVPVTNETCSAPLRECNTKEWLISVTNGTCSAPLGECNAKELLISITNQYKNAQPLICRAPELLCKDEKSAKFFYPEVVAIGPYHRCKANLKLAEDHKLAAALKFTSGRCIHEFYNKVKNVTAQARACYADKFELTDEEFACMLFFDGCFLLHFIDCCVKKKMEEFTMSTHLHGFIRGDMFLLENQLPFVVLDALMSLKQVKLDDFFLSVIEKARPYEAARAPYHLLDLLRTKLLGPPNDGQQAGQGEPNLNTFRSVKELREVGIKFRLSESHHLSDIKFHPGIVCGTLSLPKIVIDDLTRSQYLNMIALEMCSGSAGDYGITSFAWFLDCLIDRAEDVRELREKEILINALGSDEQVAELFNEIATDLAPDYRAYVQVLTGISDHRKAKFKVSIFRFLDTHFSSPWTAIAFFAALVLLALSVIQTIFTVYPRS